MNDQRKSPWAWRIARGGLITLAVLATLVAVLVTEENWRGKRAWENYKRGAEARGERFDGSVFAPTSVPDDQNFVRAPIFSNLWTLTWDDQTQDWKPGPTKSVDRLRMPIYRADGSSPAGVGGAWDRARLTRMENWQEYYRNSVTNGLGEFPVAGQAQSPAADVLLALSKYAPAIEELREASRRPYSRMGVYSADDTSGFARFMQYLARTKGCSQVLQLRAIAELDNNQSAKALDDVQLLLRLTDRLRQEPLLIAQLVSIAITAITLQPIYEGLAQHRWNDAQLTELERTLATKDYLADYQQAMRGELTFAIDSQENRRITREIKTVVGQDDQTRVVTVSLRLTPSAYFYQSELAFARLNEQYLRPLVDVTNRLVSPTAVRRTDEAVRAQMNHYSLYKIEAFMTYPAISKAVVKFAYIQSAVDLARVACALERFRLAHGDYPETLDALTPQFIATLPHDVVNGQPLHYRRTEAGQFMLYSVGWDEKDDDGQNAFTKSGTIDREKGDWVWKN
jgi:hypothetical protein